jgi:hypothetical protein
MEEGQKVTVFLFGGGKAQRRVVADKKDVVVICSEDEYQSAIREGRPPSGLGFPREDIEEFSERKAIGSEMGRMERVKAGD